MAGSRARTPQAPLTNAVQAGEGTKLLNGGGGGCLNQLGAPYDRHQLPSPSPQSLSSLAPLLTHLHLHLLC